MLQEMTVARALRLVLGTLALVAVVGCGGSKGGDDPYADGGDGLGPNRVDILDIDGLPDRPGGVDIEDPFGDGSGQVQPVQFAYDSALIDASETAKLEAVYSILARDSSLHLTIEGHCDERGSREYNVALGERRALAARAYLVGLGADGRRIQTSSYGEEKPVAMGHDPNSWRRNRRAEFKFSR